MLSLTKQERTLIIFLAALILCGITISYLLKRQPALREFYNCENITAANETLMLDINKATEEELVRLPGVGPEIAKRIIRERQRQGGFRNIEELKAVKGIGDKKLQMIRPNLIIK